MNETAQSLIKELIDHVNNPPGGDLVLKSFYQALVEMFLEDKPIVTLISTVKKRRPNLTNKHLVNLLFRAYQYLKFEEKDYSYRKFNSPSLWHSELAKIVSNKKTRNKFSRILSKKSTTTTIYQRYVGPYIVIARVFGQNPINIADFGCGGNYGLRGIELNIPFKPIEDLTPNKSVLKLLSQKINFKYGLALDKENPNYHHVRKWRMACGFYPNELDNLEQVILFEEKIKQAKNVKFVRANLLSLEQLPNHKFDVIILSMILYELTLEEQVTLIKNVKKNLNDDGIIIVQDFAAKDYTSPLFLRYDVSWFGRDFSFRTFVLGELTEWNFLEILQWNSGRCTQVRHGEDFKRLFSTYKSRAFKPALAHSTS